MELIEHLGGTADPAAPASASQLAALLRLGKSSGRAPAHSFAASVSHFGYVYGRIGELRQSGSRLFVRAWTRIKRWIGCDPDKSDFGERTHPPIVLTG